MIVRLLPQAELELDDAIAFYEEQLEGLGRRFFSSVQETIGLIQCTPMGWRLIAKHTRRINIKRFPYLILYIVDGDEAIVTSVAHQHRDPRYYINQNELLG
jgi:plasmid stabilization system protein ParE